MKKVININFQGRVIPIEETAYDLLKEYVESLRRYFANEEGRDEIINDIEGRIAELFSERLKGGVTCITDDDVNAVIASMGRPADFEAESGESMAGSTYSEQSNTNTGSTFTASTGRGRLYRNADDKILGGVCSGLGNYLKIDPVVLRILFVVLIAPLFWVYILLWIIIPAQSIQSNTMKRLYRDPDHKVIGGVCGGLAAYFNIDVWIPRLIFALPFFLGLISGGFNALFGDWDFGYMPRVITGSFGSTLLVTYIILWIAVPEAATAADRLEMRGERIDLNSIRNTVKEDMQNFRTRAEKWGAEVKETASNIGARAQSFGQSAATQARTFTGEVAPVARRTGNGLGHLIRVLFKAFFFFIAAIFALSLFGVLIGILFSGFAFIPFKSFLLEGFWQNLLSWSTLFLFLGIPLIALITWLIRRIMGVRSQRHYLGYVFGGLWIIGLVSAVLLTGMIARNFKNRSNLPEQEIAIVQPSNNKLYIDLQGADWRRQQGDFFGVQFEDNDFPFHTLTSDSVMLRFVRIKIVKSNDSAFHVYEVNKSRGRSVASANATASRINYSVQQRDSALYVQRGFAISEKDKFRSQEVLVVVEVPVGGKFQFDPSIQNADLRVSTQGTDWEHYYTPTADVEYTMMPDGRTQPTADLDPVELKRGRLKVRISDSDIQIETDTPGSERKQQYRYRRSKPDTTTPASKDTTVRTSASLRIADTQNSYEIQTGAILTSTELSTPLTVLSTLFQ
jgi:phage shock protein PspC (stress-responsive transcriptional regulator)